MEITRETLTPLVRYLTSYCGSVEVAGSLRRRGRSTHDADLLVIPRQGVEHLKTWIERYGGLEGEAASPPVAKAGGSARFTYLFGEVPVDFLVTDALAWGAALLHLTGSKEHNIRMRSAAKKRGWLLNEKGLWREAVRFSERMSERDILESLGIGWVPPEER